MLIYLDTSKVNSDHLSNVKVTLNVRSTHSIAYKVSVNGAGDTTQLDPQTWQEALQTCPPPHCEY